MLYHLSFNSVSGWRTTVSLFLAFNVEHLLVSLEVNGHDRLQLLVLDLLELDQVSLAVLVLLLDPLSFVANPFQVFVRLFLQILELLDLLLDLHK